MSFSEDSIGFFLQMEDQITPKVPKVLKSYDALVEGIEKRNRRIFKSVSAMTSQIADMLGAAFKKKASGSPSGGSQGRSGRVPRLPSPTGRSGAKTPQKVTVVGPVQVKLEGMSIGKQVEKAVAKVLRQVTVRASATPPLRKSKHFDTSVPLKPSYRELLQPPDMLGVFQNLPKFQEGGLVPGSPKGKDSVLAMVAPGEYIVPADVLDADMFAALEEIRKNETRQKRSDNAKARPRDSKGRFMKMSDMQDITEVVDETTESLTDYRGVMKSIAAKMGKWLKGNKKTTSAIEDQAEAVESASEASEDAADSTTKWGRGLSSALRPLDKFISKIRDMREAAGEKTAESLRVIGDRVQGIIQPLAGGFAAGAVLEQTQDEADGFVGTMLELQTSLGLAEDAWLALGERVIDVTLEIGKGAIVSGETADQLMRLRDTGRFTAAEFAANIDEFSKTAAVLALLEKGYRGTGLAVDALAEPVMRLEQMSRLSREQIQAQLVQIGEMALNSKVSGDTLTGVFDSVSKSAAFASARTAESQQNILESTRVLTASLGETLGEGAGNVVSEIVSALEDPERFAGLSNLLGGLSADEIEAELSRGAEGALAIVERMQTGLRRFGTDDIALTAQLKELIPDLDASSAAFQRLIQGNADLVGEAEEARKAIVGQGRELEKLDERARAGTRTFERFKKEMMETVKRAFLPVLGVVEELDPIMLALGIAVLPQVISGFAALSAVLAPVGLSVTGIVVAGVALGAALFVLNKRFDLVGKGSAVLTGVWESLSTIGEDLWPLIESVGEELGVFGEAASTSEGDLAGWVETGRAIGDVIKRVVVPVVAFAANHIARMNAVISAAGEVFAAAWPEMVKAAEPLTELFQELVAGLEAAFGVSSMGSVKSWGEMAKFIFQSMADGLVVMTQLTSAFIMGWVQLGEKISEGIMAVPGLWDRTTTLLLDSWNIMVSGITGAWDAVATAVSNVWSTIKEVFSQTVNDFPLFEGLMAVVDAVNYLRGKSEKKEKALVDRPEIKAAMARRRKARAAVAQPGDVAQGAVVAAPVTAEVLATVVQGGVVIPPAGESVAVPAPAAPSMPTPQQLNSLSNEISVAGQDTDVEVGSKIDEQTKVLKSVERLMAGMQGKMVHPGPAGGNAVKKAPSAWLDAAAQGDAG